MCTTIRTTNFDKHYRCSCLRAVSQSLSIERQRMLHHSCGYQHPSRASACSRCLSQEGLNEFHIFPDVFRVIADEVHALRKRILEHRVSLHSNSCACSGLRALSRIWSPSAIDPFLRL